MEVTGGLGIDRKDLCFLSVHSVGKSEVRKTEVRKSEFRKMETKMTDIRKSWG